MKIRDLKIGTQLQAGFGIIILLIIVLGYLTWRQNNQLAKQTLEMYEHPLMVQRALGDLKTNVLVMHRGMKDLFLSESQEELVAVLQVIDQAKEQAFSSIDTLYKLYLGPRQDIDSISNNFIIWNTMREETIRLFMDGQKQSAALRTKSNIGIAGMQAELIFEHIATVDSFARAKADEFLRIAMKNKTHLNITTLLFIILSLIVSIIIVVLILNNIRKPLYELGNVIEQFRKGNNSARTSYTSKNIFGSISLGFNLMLETIDLEFKQKEVVASITDIMLQEDDARTFCNSLLDSLLQNTDSQIGAIYFLNDEKSEYEIFESIGLQVREMKSFSAKKFEGELGKALSSKKIQFLKNIPEDSGFTFYSTSGSFKPREIVTIPIYTGDETIAVISLASVKKVSSFSRKVLKNILPMLNARITGIITHHKIVLFAEELEEKNIELDTQKKELSSQAKELQEQNIELEFQKKQLDEASRLKTNFLSNMSHELRTPLNSVIALSGVLNRRLKAKIDKEEYSYIDVIERNGKHLLSLINDILDISRIEAGHEDIEITSFNINHLIADIVEMINPQAVQKNIELIHLNNDDEFLIKNDVTKCRHILQNIISNAVKFTEKGSVVVAVKQINDQLEISVKDTGIGIDQEHLPHIYDEFRQADSSTSRRFGGTGLGLAIAQKLTRILGGSLLAQSEPGKGSVFTLILSLSYFSNSKLGVETGTDKEQRGNKLKLGTNYIGNGKRILMVEDSEAAIIQVKDIFEDLGYEIQVAMNGEEALTEIQHKIPDAIILDLMMPGIDGFEVLKLLRENQRTLHIPILILTAKHITKEELKFLKQNNIHQLIQKGDVNRNELLMAVASMIFPEEKKTAVPKPVQQIEGKPVVLVVEDNPDNMLTVKAILGNDYSILEANNGLEGIALAEKFKPHFIIMDIALPEMDGIEAFKKIRENNQLEHIPVIALTASAMIDDRETILAHGFDAYIAKPIEEKVFFETINNTLYGK